MALWEDHAEHIPTEVGIFLIDISQNNVVNSFDTSIDVLKLVSRKVYPSNDLHKEWSSEKHFGWKGKVGQ